MRKGKALRREEIGATVVVVLFSRQATRVLHTLEVGHRWHSKEESQLRERQLTAQVLLVTSVAVPVG